MPRTPKGGTEMYCPECKQTQVCQGLSPVKSGQRLYIDGHDVHFFRRRRRCLECGHEWLNAEVNEDFLDELIELRNALSSIKMNIETYVKESKKAAIALNELSSSLKIVKDLRIYREVSIDENDE